MANYETEAIIVGSKNFGDTDKIVTLFTLARGKVKAVAYGARRPKNPLAAPLQTFHHVNAAISEGKNLDIVRSAELKERFPKIVEDLTKTAYAMFVMEILSEIFPENDKEPDVFEFTLKILNLFEIRNPRITATLAAWKYASFAGFSLSLDKCAVCGKDAGLRFSPAEGGFLCDACHTKDETEITDGAKKLLINFIKFDWGNIDNGLNFSVQGDKLVEVEKLLINYLQHILGFRLKSLKFITMLDVPRF